MFVGNILRVVPLDSVRALARACKRTGTRSCRLNGSSRASVQKDRMAIVRELLKNAENSHAAAYLNSSFSACYSLEKHNSRKLKQKAKDFRIVC